jgi:hypothetical protein
MLLAALAILLAVAAFLLGYGLAVHIARRRLFDHARRNAEINDELERRLIKLGVGLGVGA